MQYFGGKQKISTPISKFVNSLPPPRLYYVEPFCGSCNVASKVSAEHKILNDKNPYLMAMFQALQDGWIPPTEVTEMDYYNARRNQEAEPHVAGFVGFACSFAGKFWGGYARDKKGVNGGANYALRGYNSIMKKMEGLQGAEFICRDFLELDFEGCVIYCDPPYKNTTQYDKAILGEFPYNDFLTWVEQQSRKNIVLTSEYKHNVPEGANIVLEMPSKTSIRDKGGNVIETIEVLWTWNNL